MRRLFVCTLGAVLLLAGAWCLAQAQQGQPVGPYPPCSAFGTSAGTCAKGNQLMAPPGLAVNVSASLAAAGTSVTFTADSIQACTALNGSCYQLPSYSQTLNTATTGAGGMDTGTTPGSGFVAVYAIYNPSSPATSILGYSCASACGTIYPGANMPSGYTASALLAVWPTNATPALVIGYVSGRNIALGPTNVLSSSSTSASCTELSISSFAPPNAVTVDGNLIVQDGSTASVGISFLVVAADSACTIGKKAMENTVQVASVSASSEAPFTGLHIATSQNLYYTFSNSGTSPSTIIQLTGYTIPGP